MDVSTNREGKITKPPPTQAEQLIRPTLEAQRRIVAPEHPDTLLSQTNLAAPLQGAGQLDEAERLARDALAIERRSLGDENSLTLEQM
jgi:hypothetical protein